MINTDLENASKIMIGSQEAEAIYVGSNLIWNSVVPYDAELEYLQNDSNKQAYINTLISTTNDMIGADIEINLAEYVHDKWGFGTNTYQNGDRCGMQIGCYNNLLIASIYGQSNKYAATISYTNNKWYNIKLNCLGHAVNVDGTELANSQQISNLGPSGNNILLFARGGNLDRVNNTKPNIKIKYCKIYRNDTTLIRDFIPVRVGQVGYMYDKISGQLFGNNGSGNFILGPDKLPSEYTELEYIETSGTQWIDTGITSTSTMVSQIKFNLLSTSSSSHVYGYRKANDYESYRLFFNGSTGLMYDGPGTSTSNKRRITMNNSVSKDTVFEFELGNNYVKNLVTGNNIGSSNSKYLDGISTITLSYWEGNGSNSDVSSARWYYVKIYEDSTLILDLIPVRKDGVGYMFDRVSKTLFTNQGTGDFILGPDKS